MSNSLRHGKLLRVSIPHKLNKSFAVFTNAIGHNIVVIVHSKFS